jgi:hypothetical protein
VATFVFFPASAPAEVIAPQLWNLTGLLSTEPFTEKTHIIISIHIKAVCHYCVLTFHPVSSATICSGVKRRSSLPQISVFHQ